MVIHDANIVATALVHGVPAIVTESQADFRQFDQLVEVIALGSVVLESEGLVSVAAAVARLFVDRAAATASDRDVDAVLAAAGIGKADERYAKREALNRLGYVWRPPNQQPPFRWHPGIPSLMDHALRQAAS